MKKIKGVLSKSIRLLGFIGQVILEAFKLIVSAFWKASVQAIVIGLPAASLYGLYKLVIQKHPVDFIGVYVLTPLAILIAFSSLLYGRSRALSPEKSAKSIESADYIFRSAILYTFALVFGFVITSFDYFLKLEGNQFLGSFLGIAYFPSFLAICFAYIDLWRGLTAIWPEIKK